MLKRTFIIQIIFYYLFLLNLFLNYQTTFYNYFLFIFKYIKLIIIKKNN